MLDVVMIRVQTPILWNSTATPPRGVVCGFIFLWFAQEDVEKQCPEARGEY